MKTTIIKLIVIAIMAVTAISCNNPEPLTNYSGWTVVEKPIYLLGEHGNVDYYLTVQKDSLIKKVHTFQFYFQMYENGDIIGVNPSLSISDSLRIELETANDYIDFLNKRIAIKDSTIAKCEELSLSVLLHLKTENKHNF